MALAGLLFIGMNVDFGALPLVPSDNFFFDRCSGEVLGEGPFLSGARLPNCCCGDIVERGDLAGED